VPPEAQRSVAVAPFSVAGGTARGGSKSARNHRTAAELTCAGARV
jgi:hypothetical protein